MSDYNNYDDYDDYDDYDECKKYEDYEEYEDYDEDGFLDYLRNLLFSPRSLGEQIKNDLRFCGYLCLYLFSYLLNFYWKKKKLHFRLLCQ